MVHPRLSRAAPRDRQVQMAAAAPFWHELSELDLHLLDLLCGLRVMTQTQLERLHPDVPGRTLRYRTQRLHRLRLVGRTRPYRASGSAPYHLWPTNRADALVRGERPARRGERRAPNPLFQAHAAALSELFVVLHTRVKQLRLNLIRFDREGEAREDFHDADGGRRAIVPDARIVFSDVDGLPLVANVEIDLGTMTHARLRMKLRGYLAHARWRSDDGEQDPPPTLLFITTSPQRARTFLETAAKLKAGSHPAGKRLTIAACAGAPHLDASITSRGWRTTDDPRTSTLADCLRAAPHAEPLTLAGLTA
jgi:hypothetical protein